MEIFKEVIAGINEILKNDKFLGFLAVIILALIVSGLDKGAPPGVLEWYKMALSGLFGAIMGYSLKR